MNVLVACEFSGTVRDEFIKFGHAAVSCDLLPTASPGPHYQGDVREIINHSVWDLIIAHPPCTCICCSGNAWYAETKKRAEAIRFVEELWNAPCQKICIENPVGVLSTKSKLGKPTQYIQPWQFGHGETKKTGLWLKNLPKLQPTNIVSGRENRVWKMSPSPNRGMLRSITYSGIAKAMAEQWGG